MKNEICTAALKNDMLLLINSGISKNDIEGAAGISLAQLNDPDEMVAVDHYIAIEKAAPELANNPGIFIELGRVKTGTSQTGVLGHVAAACETLLESFQQAIRFSRLLSNVNRMELREEGYLAEFVFTREPPAFFTIQSIELAFSRTLTLMKDLWGDNFEPNEVHFQYSPPEHVELYHKIFKNAQFNQPENQILFLRKLLLRKNPFRQPYVDDVIRKHAEKLLEKKTEKTTIQQQVIAIITKYLPKGQLNIELVASELGMSRQTVFRKLKSEAEISFQELLDGTRMQLAKDYVNNSDFMLTEIAYLLGFSENSAFHRAFKRWFNKTPREYRSLS
ncbi:MAG: AraC family transcriptional regulator [Deltaproteobacteria bacterium]|nr:AraC family transcriptional regulator [Deltaproteobacteria bacterium]